MLKRKKLKNIIVGGVAICMATMGAAVLSSCAKKTISPAEVYEQLKNAPTSIEVTFSDEYIGEFTLTDSEQINTVYNFIIGHKYELTDSLMPSTNRYLKLIYGEGEDISMSTRYITYRDRLYSLGAVSEYIELDGYLEEIGLENGWIEPH
ncbi:MAG: hypothetical protein K2O44_03700 [Clostridia bacterium]|nr:hypothetical protein [Clostridia bacterium]